jgi:hypothetical protein
MLEARASEDDPPPGRKLIGVGGPAILKPPRSPSMDDPRTERVGWHPTRLMLAGVCEGSAKSGTGAPWLVGATYGSLSCRRAGAKRKAPCCTAQMQTNVAMLQQLQRDRQWVHVGKTHRSTY